MLRLIVQNGLLAGQEIRFARVEQQFLTLGSADGCDINLVGYRVSAFHAAVVLDGDNISIIDQGSHDGTFVNGECIDSTFLRDGDIIELGCGGPRLQVLIDEPVLMTDRDYAIIPVKPTPGEIIRKTAGRIGLYDPVRDSGRAPRSVDTGFVLVLIFAIFGITVLSLTSSHLGMKIVLISGFIAFITAVFYLRVFLWLDRFDPEPPRTLAFAFAWGATIAVFFSGVINDFAHLLLGEMLTGVLSAPIIEEGSKGLGVLLIALLFHKDFDSVVDGIVYAGVVALGFATMENIDYYGMSLAQGGLNSLIGTFVVRGVLSPFAHVLFTSMTGIGCGIARETHSWRVKLTAITAGITGAMLLHALWNGLASYDEAVFMRGYLLLQVPLFICFILVIAH
ncbi:MAG: PrsW family intramembrane metalloprotease, partial [Blastocatellia bacterium]|nr:PrsW family intramembrane metalloprotease [Blastocatellia bacterium]